MTTDLSSRLFTVPVLHGRLELAVTVRQALEGVRPSCIAVELPETLDEPVKRAARRLPLLSVIRYASSSGAPTYLLAEPADPLFEAVRYGLLHELPVVLVDLDVDEYGRHPDPLPDSYAVKRIGHAAYVRAVEQALDAAEPGRGVFCADANDAVRETVMAFHLQRLLREHERVLFVAGMHHARRVDARARGSEPIPEPLRRVKRSGVTLHHLSEASSREVMSELPFLSAAYELGCKGGVAGLDQLDRLQLTYELSKRAELAYEKEHHDTLGVASLGVMFRFARNYAIVEGRLAPDLYQLIIAARGAVNDNYAYELYQLATTWPYQTGTPELPVIDLTLEDLLQHARYVRFHRTEQTRRRNLLRVVKPRPKEARPGQWREAWTGNAICSHQPEDLVVESYGAFLKKKAVGLLSAEHVRVEPFLTSLLDGIDVRETVRNWHQGRLYVREHGQFRGEVGAVVVIFSDDASTEARYINRMTWQGEHDQESDMAFYATPLGAHLVGPGICRCEYGGFLLTYPPGRMFHVFEDPYFDAAESLAERLLLAGIDYATQRVVVYCAPAPPRSMFRSVAERFGKKIVYIPLGDLSPVTLKSLRVFHVLDGHPVRTWAKDYIR